MSKKKSKRVSSEAGKGIGPRGAVFCEHANEAPVECRCPANCYCKTHSCKPARSPVEKCLDCGQILETVRGRCESCGAIQKNTMDALAAYRKKCADFMRHALGLGTSKVEFRNYYCVDVGSKDADFLNQMVTEGLLSAGNKINDGHDQYYHVTVGGKVWLIDNRFATPKELLTTSHPSPARKLDLRFPNGGEVVPAPMPPGNPLVQVPAAEYAALLRVVDAGHRVKNILFGRDSVSYAVAIRIEMLRDALTEVDAVTNKSPKVAAAPEHQQFTAAMRVAEAAKRFTDYVPPDTARGFHPVLQIRWRTLNDELNKLHKLGVFGQPIKKGKS